MINEVVADNASTWQEGDGTFPDWVELYNAGDEPVELSRVTLEDSGTGVWRGDGGRLFPGDRRLVPLGVPGEASFGIDADGDILTLSVDGQVVDRLHTGMLPADVAWARHPDGGSWARTILTTPDLANPATPSDDLDVTGLAFGRQVHEIAIELDPDDAASLRADRFGWVEAAVEIDGLRYAPVTVRLKSSHGSKRELDQKPGFKIDLGELADFRWHGLEHLTLNNMVQDPTYIREHLAYTTYRAMGVPAPRVAWAHVTVSGEDHGLSLLVEPGDGSFLEHWYTDPGGSLYEGGGGVDLVPGGAAQFEYDEGPDPDDRTDLEALIDAISRPPDAAGLARFEGLANLDEVLRHLAGESLTLHWDSYKNINNYKLYDDPDTGFQMLPWGADEAWQRVQFDPWSGQGALLRYCLGEGTCRARYDEALEAGLDTIDTLDLPTEAIVTEAWLRPWIEADAKREFDMDRHDSDFATTVALLTDWPAAVRDMLAREADARAAGTDPLRPRPDAGIKRDR